MSEILVGLDRSERASDVVEEAVRLARDMKAKIHVLHLVTIPPDLPTNLWGTSGGVAYATIAREARAEIEGLLAPVPPELLGEVNVHAGAPWSEICALGTERDVDLIIIGAHGYGLLERTLGTTASKVVDHADRPVLIVRRKGVAS